MVLDILPVTLRRRKFAGNRLQTGFSLDVLSESPSARLYPKNLPALSSTTRRVFCKIGNRCCAKSFNSLPALATTPAVLAVHGTRTAQSQMQRQVPTQLDHVHLMQ